MEEAFAEQIIPGTYIRVLSEGLISPQGVAAGNIGIVGTAEPLPLPAPEGGGPAPVATLNTSTQILSSLEDAQKLFAPSDAASETSKFNLMRSLELLFRNGARTVYARAIAETTDKSKFTDEMKELLKENVNILVIPELSTADANTELASLAGTAESEGRDVIAVVGADKQIPSEITAGAEFKSDKRLILCAPAIVAYDRASKKDVTLPGRYTAAAVAGLIASLAAHVSPTNKSLPGVGQISRKYNYGELKSLVQGNVLTLENRGGVRVVRGITTDGAGAAFSQITTRRIVDYAKAGVRQVTSPFVGKLNNARVRKAMEGALDGFLTTMLIDEALTDYTVNVSATRADEIAGRCVVNISLQPTFSIDYIRVTLTLY